MGRPRAGHHVQAANERGPRLKGLHGAVAPQNETAVEIHAVSAALLR
jgi:hypothetical protein